MIGCEDFCKEFMNPCGPNRDCNELLKLIDIKKQDRLVEGKHIKLEKLDDGSVRVSVDGDVDVFFRVNITLSERDCDPAGTYISDKTYQEIIEAINKGKHILARVGDYYGLINYNRVANSGEIPYLTISGVFPDTTGAGSISGAKIVCATITRYDNITVTERRITLE